MGGIIVRLLASVVWIAAAIFLATKAPADRSILRVAAAVLVGLPGGLRFVREVEQLWGVLDQTTAERVKRSLQAGLVKIYRDKLYPDDITQVSLHVWVVPTWYRKIIPYSIRSRVKPDALPIWIRPKIQRLAMYRWEHHAASGLRFRKGIGIVGRCIDINDPHEALRVILDRSAFRGALRNEDTWQKAPLSITHNVKYADAKKLAARYGQVSAIVLREESGEAIGCITLDLPPGSKLRLGSSSANTKTLQRIFDGTAREVENHLTGHHR
jgi:hypothetical protein